MFAGWRRSAVVVVVGVVAMMLIGVVPAALRLRHAADGDVRVPTPLSRARAGDLTAHPTTGGLALTALAAGAAAGARAVRWYLRRIDRGTATPSRRSMLRTWRAPPAPTAA